MPERAREREGEPMALTCVSRAVVGGMAVEPLPWAHVRQRRPQPADAPLFQVSSKEVTGKSRPEGRQEEKA